ncbi:hypothetical protein EV363DRAFT_1298820 [Boletus edulis]|nr:hypothetical protein EV363DRAFT_1298820 [Boletus edulis]
MSETSSTQYSEVIGYTLVGKFALLKNSHYEIANKLWAIPKNWETLTQFFKVKRSHEEICQLNVEVRRLQLWVDHDENQLKSAALDLQRTSSKLAGAMDQLYADHCRINCVHHVKLQQLYGLVGYTGQQPGLNVMQTVPDIDSEDEEDQSIQDEALRLGDALHRVVV